MRKYLLENKVLIIVLLCGLIAAIVAVGGRMTAESANKTYDVVVDYVEIEAMAKQSGETTGWWLQQFKEMGITKVGLTEECFSSLDDASDMPVEAAVSDIVMDDADWRSNYPQSFVADIESKGLDNYDVIASVFSKEAFDFLSTGLAARFDNERFAVSPEYDAAGNLKGGYIWLDGTVADALYSDTYKEFDTLDKGFIERTDILTTKLMYISLGLWPEKVQTIEDLGMEVIPRTQSYTGWNDKKYAKAVIDGYNKLAADPEYLVVAGEAVAGYDDGIDSIVDYIDKTGASIGLIETTSQLKNIEQDGAGEVVKATGYNTVRVFSVWNYIQYRYKYYGYEGGEEVENTLFRAITERNIRVIYFKPMKETDDEQIYITDVEEYKQLFSNLDKRLERHGISMGRASVMPPFTTPPWLKTIMGFGALAATILMLAGFLPVSRKIKNIVLIAGMLGVIGVFYALPNSGKLLLSFGAAFVFACLAIILTVMQVKHDADTLPKDAKLTKIIPQAALALTAGVAVALMGGIMTAAPISEISFMLELDVFRGVKLAQLAPLAFFVIAFLAYFGFTEQKKKSNRLEANDLLAIMNINLKVWMVLVGAAIAGVGAYYIIRTGHTSSITPSTAEMLLRNDLEDLLIARPRTKEFLFAFPALMLFVYTAVRKWKLLSALFGLCSVIGLTSVINTFMHIRTPLYLGFMRTAFSFVLGLMIGALAIVVFEGLYRLWAKLVKLYNSRRQQASETGAE